MLALAAPKIRIVYDKSKDSTLFFSLLLAMAAQADVLGEYSFEGTLGDKIPVRLKFAVNGDEIAVGEIYYPKAKNPVPILVVGAPTNDDAITGPVDVTAYLDYEDPQNIGRLPRSMRHLGVSVWESLSTAYI